MHALGKYVKTGQTDAGAAIALLDKPRPLEDFFYGMEDGCREVFNASLRLGAPGVRDVLRLRSRRNGATLPAIDGTLARRCGGKGVNRVQKAPSNEKSSARRNRRRQSARGA